MFKFMLILAGVVFFVMLLSILRTAYLSDLENQKFWEKYDAKKKEMSDYKKEIN